MATFRRRHALPLAALTAAAAFSLGCSSGEQSASSDDPAAAAPEPASLDGVSVDVRRDPG